ncbi:ShlB/FhaC/HecB family hemolysin secretion/activation protein [Inquilinus sp. Marseille-Q2685]|uniref:ShlB/FhaC/HecB family hemolysin secretion/activation protein n=1 Tax=Inquilinus sp. Marseille-Q2685 TaxID=2866581 RepID=UPI001CE4A5D8|nr:ShlB/FhaC/HecB family hemolysin secretion/activation protein [Inquilinus sp. Marseille-Q2685]
MWPRRGSRLVVAGWAACAPLLAAAAQAAAPEAPAAAEAPGEPASAPSAAPPAAANRFDILEYQVQGNTVLPVVQIEEAIYPFLGPDRTIDDVEGARAALEKRYADAGYITVAVNIPEQTVREGVVRLEVVEARVGRLRVRNSRYYSLGRIKGAAPSLAEGTVPQLAGIQRDSEVLNRLPGRTVTPQLKAGVEPGTVDADLNVEDESPFQASVELNNQYSANTKPLRLSGSVGYDNLWQLGHSVSLQYTTAPEDPDQTSAIAATYTFRIPEWKESLVLYGITSSSNVATLGGVNVIGDGTIVGGRGVLPLPGLTDFYHTLMLGLDWKDFGERQLFGADESETPITYTTATIEYNATRPDTQGTTSASLSATFGLRGLGDPDDKFEQKRAGASADFAYFRAGLERQQILPAEFELTARLDGQLASQPLISNEQFSAGGVSSVPGYLESEELGDNGWIAALRLSTPNLGQWIDPSVVEDWRVYAYGDFAELWLQDANPGQDDEFQLASLGFGSRVKLLNHLTGSVDLAVPLIDASDTKANDIRILFTLGASL